VPSVDPSLVSVIESLPRKHRQHLEAANAESFPKGATKRAKAEIIATRVGPRDIQRYDHLYLSGNGLSFVWFFLPGKQPTLATLATLLERKYGARLTSPGLEPGLDLDDDPKLHRMIHRDKRIELQFGLRDNDRQVFRGWQYHAVESDHVYTVVLKSDPFTVEVRAPFPTTQAALMRSLAAEIATVDFTAAQQCGLTTEALRRQLETQLPSELFGKWDVGTGHGLGSSRMYSDETTPLRTQQDFVEQSGHDHRKLTHLDYRFDIHHPFDGYIERAEYGVNLQTGDMRVGPRTSEIALEHLRTNVIRIVSAPTTKT